MNTEVRRYPLESLTVVDLGQIYNGSYATFLMAMQVRVSSRWSRRTGSTCVAARASAALRCVRDAQLEQAVGHAQSEIGTRRELLRTMVTRADVLLENFAPGTMDRLGVGWSVLKEVNPRLIYASGSGYGLSGPYRDYPAMDLTVQAWPAS